MSIKMNNEYLTNDGSSSKEKLKLPAARPVDELRSSRCRESSKCKEMIPFYYSSLANPVAPLKRDLRFATTRLVDELKSCRSSRVARGNALAVAFSTILPRSRTTVRGES